MRSSLLENPFNISYFRSGPVKILSLFRSKKLGPAWHYSAEGVLWRILFSTTGKIVGEVRKEEEKQASFFCLDERTGSVLWEGLQIEEPWWVGIDALHFDTAFLHEFEKPDLPEHKKIRAVDLGTGRELWRNDDLTFWFAFQNRVYAYKNRFDRRAGYVLDASSGELLESHEEGVESLSSVRSLVQHEGEQEGFRFPHVYDGASEEPQVNSLIRAATKNRSVSGNIEYLKAGEYLLMNYYTPGRLSVPDMPLLENRLHVFEYPAGKPVFSDVLADNATAPTPDSFFVKDNILFFVKDRHLLTAIRLTKS